MIKIHCIHSFGSIFDDVYAPRLDFWRNYVMNVIYKYLDCGDLHMGFARVRCFRRMFYRRQKLFCGPMSRVMA